MSETVRARTRPAIPVVDLGPQNEDHGSPKAGSSGQGKKLDHRMLLIVFISLLLDLLAFTMILPLLPALLDYYADHDSVSLCLISHRVTAQAQGTCTCNNYLAPTLT